MTRLFRSPLSTLCICLSAASLLAACGGGDSAPAASTTPTVTTLSGNVVKGPVSGSTVCAFKAVATGKGEQIKCATTTSAGAYTMDIDYTGDVVLEATGGTYTDEATNTTKTLGDPMQVVVASQGGATVGVITPLTSVAYSVARSSGTGVSSTSFAAAASGVASQFQLGTVNISTTVPVVTGSVNGYGQVLRAVSQFVANGNTLAAFQAFNNAGGFQAAFSTAFAAINGTTISFNFGGSTTGTGGTGGTGTGTGTGTGGTVPSTNKTLVVTVTVMGSTSTINVGSVPAPTTQAEFCSAVQTDTTFSQISAGAGGTLTINSCSFSGNSGTISATVSITAPVAITVPYTVNYQYQ